ncbi:MAG: LacI family transcriptional regulator [Bacteroidetes bacterium]|nr:LacI family transcriptional regulator [Bacteroidota bacterium]
MTEFKRAGIRIPEQTMFAGFNNDLIAAMIEPNLTTIDYKGHEMGQIAARTLINRLNNPENFNVTQSIVIRHELLVRNSSQSV